MADDWEPPPAPRGSHAGAGAAAAALGPSAFSTATARGAEAQPRGLARRRSGAAAGGAPAGARRCLASAAQELPPELAGGDADKEAPPWGACTERGFQDARQQLAQKATVPPVPHSFRCPLCAGIMRDPVMTVEGLTFDRSCITRWFNSGGTSCPVTGKSLDSFKVIANRALREAISDYLALQDDRRCMHRWWKELASSLENRLFHKLKRKCLEVRSLEAALEARNSAVAAASAAVPLPSPRGADAAAEGAARPPPRDASPTVAEEGRIDALRLRAGARLAAAAAAPGPGEVEPHRGSDFDQALALACAQRAAEVAESARSRANSLGGLEAATDSARTSANSSGGGTDIYQDLADHDSGPSSPLSTGPLPAATAAAAAAAAAVAAAAAGFGSRRGSQGCSRWTSRPRRHSLPLQALGVGDGF